MSWADEKPFVDSMYSKLIRDGIGVEESAVFADVCARACGFPTWCELADTPEFWVEQRAEMLQLPEVAR